MKTGLTIVSGESVFGFTKWFAYRSGRRGRLSPMFKKYDDLLDWLRLNGHL